MAKLIRSMSNYPIAHHWHIIGDDSKTTQYLFACEVGKDIVHIKRLTHYGTGGVNSSTGEYWGDPSVWEILPSWEFSGLISMWKRDKKEAHDYVEAYIKRYVKEDLNIDWDSLEVV
jgi:hypothetical protein